MAKIYVASSWRNQYYPEVVKRLREAGHEVYDFRNPPHGQGGFKWQNLDPDFARWNVNEYKQGLKHPSSELQFKTDLDALNWADTCLLVLPCGRSAHTEAGWMKGSGKRTIVYIPEMQEPELMYKLFDLVSGDMEEVLWYLKYGEPYSGDSRFVAKCRLLQSIYREESGLAIKPYKGRDGVHYYGNYIENGEITGANFLEEYIFEYAKKRVRNKQNYETIESDRLFNNLLSSQPMAFNLFYPLIKMQKESPEEATMAIRKALPMFPIHKVTEIDLEFIPENYMDLTGDKSAMDAIIRFESAGGKSAFIAIETKYSENLGSNEASDKSKSKTIEKIKQLKCFRPDIEERINDIKLTQIYRNFLLSECYGRYIDAESFSIVLAPMDHTSTDKEVKSLTDELREEYRGRIQPVALEDFVNALISNSDGEYKAVFQKFYDRYLNFAKNYSR